MLKKLFSRPLKLNVGDKILQFSSADDFAFIVGGRTAVSTAKLSELFKQTRAQLEEQAIKISKVKSSLNKVIVNAAEQPDSINRSLRELEPTIFSQDHNWREIIKSLNEGDEEFNALRNIAVANYMKYLSSLEETIGHIRHEKQTSEKASSAEADKIDFGATWASMEDAQEPEVSTTGKDRLKRLPKEKAVRVRLQNDGDMDLRLATYECKLAAKENLIQFVDHAGTTTLNKGRHIIGRSSKSSIKIDPTQKYVSREHLQIVVRDDLLLELTDLSSVGTYISDEYLIS